MSPEVDVMSTMWNVVIEYIPSKERQALADHLVNVIADEHSISDIDLKAFGASDGYLTRAVAEYLGEDEETGVDSDDEW